MADNSEKVATRSWGKLLFICGIFTVLLAPFVFTIGTLAFWTSPNKILDQNEQIIILLKSVGSIVVFCGLLFLAGLFLLRRGVAAQSISAVPNRKWAWASKSISARPLLYPMLWFCIGIAAASFFIPVNYLNGSAAVIQGVPSSKKTGVLMGGAIQGMSLNLIGAATTIAGSGIADSLDAMGTSASFNQPFGITTDGSNLYVADSSNHAIRKIVIETGVVSTLAGSGQGYADGAGKEAWFSYPYGITNDGVNLYVADTWNHTIRKIVMATGEATTLAGSRTKGYADGTGTAASFNYPRGITTDGGNLYVADTFNHTIRKIVIATGAVMTLAGSKTNGNADGMGTAASFNYPRGITTDGSNLYVADTFNHTIRKIVVVTGEVTTLAGSRTKGYADGTGTAATFNNPDGLTTDGSNLYVGDADNNIIRKIVIATREVTTLSGSKIAGSADANGAAASFDGPAGITTDGNYLYVADADNHKIRKIK